MRDLSVVVFSIMVLLFAYFVLFTPLNISNNVITGLTISDVYSGYGVPINGIVVDSNLSFSGPSDTISRTIDVSDDIVYRRAYISYDGSSWTPFNLTPSGIGTLNGNWIYGRGISNIVFSPSMLHLNNSRNFTNNTYIIIYSCSKNTTIHNWSCHDGWQIVAFNAKLNSASLISPTITFIAPTPASGSTINTSSQEIVASISDDSSAISSWIDFDKSLIGYWSMDYSSSSGIYDNSTYGNFGKYNGINSSNIITGIRGKGFSFNGTINNFIDCGSTPSLNLPTGSDVTLAAWVKIRGPPPYSDGVIVGKDFGHYFLAYASATGNFIGIINGNDCFTYTTSSSVSFNTWYFVTSVFKSGSQPQMYVNGILDPGTSYSNNNCVLAYSTIKTYIGNDDSHDYPFNGTIDEVMIFNGALSASEVKALYDSKLNKFDATFSNLANGLHSYTVYAIDGSGNLVSSDQRTFNVNAVGCTLLCSNKQCGGDGCSGTCGNCLSNQTCNLNGVCVNNVVSPVCGDGICNNNETCSNCPGDCGTCQSYKRTFYVSNSGSDSNNGTDTGHPWQTLSKVNSHSFLPGDGILFKRGDTWYGTLTVTSSGSASAPITYGSYGSGDKPIITGFTTITGWTNYGGGIYSKAVSAASVPSNMVTVNGVNTGKGQYPKAGNWLHNTAVGTGYITDNSLPSSPNWAGAQIFMKTEGYRWNHGTITSQATHQINYIQQQGDGSWSGGNGYPGWGYFIDNDLRTLTTINGIAPQLGEWFHDGTTFYMYFGGIDPATKVVKVATLDNAVICAQSYITLDSISFIGFNGDHTLGGQSAVGLSGSHYVSVTNCEIGFVGASGTFPGEHTTYDNCWIHDINGNAILGQDYNYLTLTNSIIENIGLIYSMSGGWYARGMAMNLLDGTNAFIQYNIFRHIGSFGAYIGGAPNVIVDKNLFDDCVSKAFDAGAIYVNQESPNRTISNNILINTGYSFEGTTNTYPDIWDAAPGIYLDTPNDGIIVTGNTCAGTKNGPGIMISASHETTFSNNTLYNNFEGLQILSTIPTSLTANLQFTNNKIIAASAGQLLTIIYVGVGSIPTFGFTTASGDIYARLIDDGVDQDWLTREPDINGGHNQYQTYASWLSRSGETGSTFSSVTATNPNDIRFEYNAAKTNKVITLNGNYRDVKGVLYSGNVTLAPYTSIILIKN